MENRKVAAVNQEIAEEKAAAFDRTAQALEAALAALRNFDAGVNEGPRTRAALVAAAAERLLHVLVHREACGLRDANDIYRSYTVPPEVIARLGGASPVR